MLDILTMKPFKLGLVLFLFVNAASADKGEVLEKKVGQMLMVGFRGFEITAASPIAKDIQAGRVGSVVLFDYDVVNKKAERNIRNPAQVKALIRSLKALVPETLLVAVDQEGGKVNRLKEKYGFPTSLTALKMASLSDADLKKESALLADNLSDLGFNVNFAPVVDLNTNPANPVIGKWERSFSSDPKEVFEKSKAFIQAHRDAGVLTVLKHFPGHGSSTVDSHLDLVDISETWEKKELEPYQELVKADLVDAVMTAHVFNSHLDAKYPATLSPSVIPKMLRKDIGFDGVVFSDDMQMGAIAKHYGLENAIQLALEADIDIFCFGNNVSFDEKIGEKAHGIILKLVRDGKIPESRIDRSVQRIRKLKARL